MAIADRRERERLELRAKILEAARGLFVKHGYDSVSMRKIAEAIEYSPTAIYVHFKDKGELMHELCRCDFAEMSAGANDLAKIADPIERIRAMGESYIRFGVARPNHYRLMFMTPINPDDIRPTEEDLARKDDPAQSGYAALSLAIREGIAARRFRPELNDDVELIAQTFWAAVHGVASLQVAKADDPWLTWAPLDARIKAMIDAIIAGMTVGAREGTRDDAPQPRLAPAPSRGDRAKPPRGRGG
jgi:AcrR family transcriptional regulator